MLQDGKVLITGAAIAFFVVACSGGPNEPTEHILFLDNQANERFIFRLFDKDLELRITTAGVTTNFAELAPLQETPVTIPNGVDLEVYTLVLRQGAKVLAIQTVTKEALKSRGWHLTVDEGGFR